jgi:CubicO group peptidase (beta-lactamase class C family)
MGMVGARYLPPDSWRRRIAPTEQDPWRGRMLRGEVHDENAAFLGGVSGHAGLFGTTRDLVRFGEWLVAAARSDGVVTSGERWWVPGAIVKDFMSRQEVVVGSSRALGWDTPTEQALPGVPVDTLTVWHTGFTGTAIWVDPAHQLVLVLMTNRVHPTRENSRHVALRRAVASYALQFVTGR